MRTWPTLCHCIRSMNRKNFICVKCVRVCVAQLKLLNTSGFSFSLYFTIHRLLHSFSSFFFSTLFLWFVVRQRRKRINNVNLFRNVKYRWRRKLFSLKCTHLSHINRVYFKDIDITFIIRIEKKLNEMDERIGFSAVAGVVAEMVTRD